SLDRNNGWELAYESGQQLGIKALGSVRVADARHESLRMALTPEQIEMPFTLEVRGKLQFPSEFRNFFLSVRATGTKGPFPIRVKLTDAFEADLGGVLRHLFTTFLNNRLLFSGAPRMTREGAAGKFLGELGFAAPDGWAPDPR